MEFPTSSYTWNQPQVTTNFAWALTRVAHTAAPAVACARRACRARVAECDAQGLSNGIWTMAVAGRAEWLALGVAG